MYPPNVHAPRKPVPVKETRPTSRRAMLAGVLGGIGALAATAIGGTSRTRAAAGSSLIIGSEANNAGTANTQLQTNSNVVAFKLLQNGPGTALMGYATPATGATRGVYGRTDSPDGFGLQARSAGAQGDGAAVQAIGINNHGVDASTDGVNRYAVKGTHNGAGGIAVAAISDSGAAVYGASASGFGVYGNSSSSSGVRGASNTSYGVYGVSASSYAGFFQGPARVSQYLDMPEMAAPASSGVNTARIFVRDVGGKTQVCAKFSDGSIVVMAAQP